MTPRGEFEPSVSRGGGVWVICHTTLFCVSLCYVWNTVIFQICACSYVLHIQFQWSVFSSIRRERWICIYISNPFYSMKLQCPTIINGMRNNMKMPPGAQERHTKNVSCQQGDGSQVSSGCQQGERGSKMAKKRHMIYGWSLIRTMTAWTCICRVHLSKNCCCLFIIKYILDR